jgi:hypothetical protein
MSGIPEATAIILTTAERSELEGLVRSTKTEHRLRQRARIVLFAAEGMASRDRACRRLHDRDSIEVARALWRKAV